MKVLVFAKQIPDVNQVRFDPETNRIVRENVPLSMNSFDRKAVEESIRMKEKLGAESIVASMGPPQAREILNDSLRMGADKAYLITDRQFGGSDTLATSRILSALVSVIKPDVVLMGKYSLDGETSQVPPEVAVFSGYDFKSSVARIEVEDSGKTAIVDHENEYGVDRLRVPLPAVFSVSEKINRARAIKPDTPDMSEKVEVLDSDRLGIKFRGSDYSPTVVTGTSSLESRRQVEMLDHGENLYDRLYGIISSNRNPGGEREKIRLNSPNDGVDTILGVAFRDSDLGEEVSSKVSQLASSNGLRSVVFGNIEPDSARLVGHEYYFIDTTEPEVFKDALTDFIREKKPRYVVFPSSVLGREIAGTVAARLEVGLTADCVDLEIEGGKLIQYKPAFGGGIIAKIYSKTDPQMTTVRPGMFRVLERNEPPKVFQLMYGKERKYDLLESIPVPSEYRPLGSSNVVIGIGRGIKKRDRIPPALELAELLDASLGATRPIVDMGFVPRQQQIGLTGVSISPGVYIALGISGQANHVVGIRYCGKIIAVNSDPEAPIFGFSDYGIVADIEEFISDFSRYLKDRK